MFEKAACLEIDKRLIHRAAVKEREQCIIERGAQGFGDRGAGCCRRHLAIDRG